jgi:hypothetical protein
LERIPEPASKSRHKQAEEKIRSASYATEFSCLKNTSEQKDLKLLKTCCVKTKNGEFLMKGLAYYEAFLLHMPTD